jgi:hypothetical protein
VRLTSDHIGRRAETVYGDTGVIEAVWVDELFPPHSWCRLNVDGVRQEVPDDRVVRLWPAEEASP